MASMKHAIGEGVIDHAFVVIGKHEGIEFLE
jgi:hypothetical protein